MFLLKGIFIFSGKKDITRDDIQKGIIIKIKDDDSTWLTHKIINKTDNLDIRISQIKSSLKIDFDLLTDKDYFILEALGESDNLDITYSHRIANVSKIEHGEIGLFKNAISVLLIIFIFIATCWIFMWKTKPFEIWSSDLQPAYYSNEGNLIPAEKIIQESKTIPREGIIDSSILNDSVSSFLADTKNSLQEMRSENNKRISELNFSLRSDSLQELASKEYSLIGFIMSNETKPYRISNYSFVKYRLKKGLWNFPFILSLFQILMYIAFTIEFIRMIIHYFKYKRISELTLRLFKQQD